MEAAINSYEKEGESRWVFVGKELRGVTEIEGHFMRALEEEQEFAC